MDQSRFEEGKAAYAARDYRAAAKAFLAAAGRGPGSGIAYHMAGNSLVRLRRFSDAVTIYRHALNDETYERKSAVYVNLGAAHRALGEYAEAIRVYECALEDFEYAGQYRALQGKAGALYDMGRIEDAAMAYRQAALDGDNPDPGKALNNLGMCFMAMDRATDAVEAYRAALGFDSYTGRGRALANLGMAYHVIDRHEDAVKAFEKATELHGHVLTDLLEVAYATSRSRAEQGEQREVVEGWTTAEMEPVNPTATTSVVTPPEPMPDPDTAPVDEEGEGVDAFFALTDAEMRDRDREVRREAKRLRRAERNPLTALAAAMIAVAIVGGGAVALLMWGFGYPTQEMTVSDMMQARSAGDPVAGYWVAVPTADIDKEMSKIPPMTGFVIESIERAPRTSVAVVTVTPESGAPLSYRVSLAREGVGWKVTGVDNHWDVTAEPDAEQTTP